MIYRKIFLFLFLPTSGNLVDFSNFVIIVNKIVKYIEMSQHDNASGTVFNPDITMQVLHTVLYAFLEIFKR